MKSQDIRFSLSTGYLAKRMIGPSPVQYGDTVVFVAAQTGRRNQN